MSEAKTLLQRADAKPGCAKLSVAADPLGVPDLTAEQIHRAALAEFSDRIATRASVADIKA